MFKFKYLLIFVCSINFWEMDIEKSLMFVGLFRFCQILLHVF